MSTPSLLNIPYVIKAGTLYSQIPETGAGDFAVTRATTPTANRSTRINANGFIELVNDNVPRLDYPLGGAVNGCASLLMEPNAVNLALHSRDLTNVVWVATNITPVKNAVGADNVASGATTLTATAANATILQSLTHASQSRIFSAYVRRVTGTGTIEMTTNGGTTWTAVTITSSYTRVACAPQTVTNGAVGFRIVTSGDVIVVDFCQGEVGPIATSAIPTTTQAITRGDEVVKKTGITSLIGQSEGTVYLEMDIQRIGGTNWLVFALQANTTTDFIYVNLRTGGQIRLTLRKGGGSNFDAITTSANTVGIYKIAVAYKNGDYEIYINGVSRGTSSDTSNFPDSLTQVILSDVAAVHRSMNNRLRAFALYPNRLSNSELIALTTP